MKKIYRVEIIGAENEPQQGPFLVCSNHISNHDVILIAACLQHQVRYMAKAELFKIPLLKQLISALGAYPVDRKRGDVGAIKKTISLLESGQVVGMFPQGHRYPGQLPASTPTKAGAGMIVAKTKVTVLPVSIENKKMRMRFFRKTTFRIGKPITFEAYDELSNNKSDYQMITDSIFANICSMISTPMLPSKDNKKVSQKENNES